MTKIEQSATIERPVEQVWDFLHEPKNDPIWQTSIVESQQLSEGPVGVGTRMREVRHFLGKRFEVGYELTEYEPARKSSVKVISGPIPFSGSYILEPVDRATRVTMTGELEAHGFFKLAEPVFARMARRELESSLGHLKDLLEAGA